MTSLYRRSFLGLVFLTLLVGGCTNRQASSGSREDTYPIPEDRIIRDVTGLPGGQIVLSMAGNPSTFNPLLPNGDPDQVLSSLIGATLVNLNLKTMKTELALAKNLTVSDDGLQYTFEIRKGILWSDGHPFTADDVIFTYTVLTDPAVLSSQKSLVQQEDGTFPKLEKIDENTIRFTLNAMNVLFVESIGTMCIVAKHKWEKAYHEGSFMSTMLVNTDPHEIPYLGAFTIDSLTPDQRIVLKRNPHYWVFDKKGLRLPYLDKMVRLIIADENAQLIGFLNGQIDMYAIQADQYDLVKGKEVGGPYTVYDLGPSYNTNYFQVNLNTGVKKNGQPFVPLYKQTFYQDKRFRQALSYAMDRQGLVKTVFQGRATAITSLTSPANKIWRNPHPKAYDHNLTKARKMLEDLGLRDSNNDGVREFPNGEPVRMVIKTNVENKLRIQLGNMIKQDLMKLGIESSLNPVPFNNLVQTIKETRDYDAIIMGWASGVPDDPVMMKNAILSSGRLHGWNPMQEKPATKWEAQMDQLMIQNQSTRDLKKRQKAWWQLLDIWEEELPQIMLVTANTYVAINNKFGNVQPVALRPYYEWNLDEIYDTSPRNP